MSSNSDDSKIIKASTPNSKNFDSKIDIYSKDPKTAGKDKDSMHIVLNTETGSGRIITKNAGEPKQETDTKCYLTTACMKHYMEEFDDNCYYLDILRWFRDNIVSIEDKELYYRIAPSVVSALDSLENANEVYEKIYYDIIQKCVWLIEYGKYQQAYNIYKNSVIQLESKYTKKLSLK
jgi:hypothetical protein